MTEVLRRVSIDLSEMAAEMGVEVDPHLDRIAALELSETFPDANIRVSEELVGVLESVMSTERLGRFEEVEAHPDFPANVEELAEAFKKSPTLSKLERTLSSRVADRVMTFAGKFLSYTAMGGNTFGTPYFLSFPTLHASQGATSTATPTPCCLRG